MKLKLGKKRAEPKKAVNPAAKRTVGTATSPIVIRAGEVVELLNSAQLQLQKAAANVVSWTAADGRVLRDLAGRSDSSYYWELTRKQLKDTQDGRLWVKDTVEELKAVHRQLQDFGASFLQIVHEAMDAQKAGEALERASNERPAKPAKPVKRKGGKKGGGMKLRIKT